MTMRVTCLIDSLNSGGAQRQMCMLAGLLKKQGCNIGVLTYHRLDFFRDLLEAQNITVQNVVAGSKIGRIAAIRRALQIAKPDVLISYLHTPNLLAELAGLPRRNFSLIVSERNNDFEGTTARGYLRFFCHGLADAVVCNSFVQERFIHAAAPWLRGRLRTIVNCVDLDTFHPATQGEENVPDRINVLVVGRFERQKNPLALLAAVDLLRRESPELRVVVDWYGNNFFVNDAPSDKSELYLTLKQRIRQLSLEQRFRLHAPVQEVAELYRRASVLCLPSLWEGCSNVIGEAMACGKPILASRAGDNARLVAEGENGFLFDAHSPSDIAAALRRFARLPAAVKTAMGVNSRKRAETLIGPDKLISEYMSLMEQIGGNRESP